MAENKIMPEQTLVDIAREFLEKVTIPLDKHTSHKGEIIVEGTSVSLLSPSHIQYAVYGRAPGKRPPLDPILEYVTKRNIKWGNMGYVGTAFAMMNSIAKNGSNNWVPNAPVALEESIMENIEEYNEKLAGALLINIQDESKYIFENLIPNKFFKSDREDKIFIRT